MKRVLLVHFSQTGQLARVARRLTSPLAAAGDVELVEEVLRPRRPYPFPWPAWRFLDAMPETVLLEPPALEPLTAGADERFDLVVLAYQVWYLAPSGPMTAFLKSEEGRRLLRGRPVVTVIACRNMWLVAQETVKHLIQEAGGRLRDNVAFVDGGGTLASFVTTPRWVLTGRRDAFWGLPAAGVAEEEIRNADRFGRALLAGLRADRERSDEPMLTGLGAARVNPRLIFSERAGQRVFSLWSRLIRRGGAPGSAGRRLMLALFCAYLIAVILTLVPLSLLVQRLMIPLFSRRLESQRTYFELPSGR
ncbi:MAG: dialkylresorcinol condensing enzyme [Betaproteobacteria bacterium]|nr:MAG: dialkylresorcinol condensing enzyme [Betaproteobacteria bacterium]TMH74562.1 MAG: dialkylresorcinol condensing enzyme [Betaproteobacteria bacterium]